MFDFEKLEVYKIAQGAVVKVYKLIKSNSKIDEILSKLLKRSASSVLLNLSEGTGRMSNRDKQNFYTIARGSVFESVAIMNLLKELDLIGEEEYQDIYNDFDHTHKLTPNCPYSSTG